MIYVYVAVMVNFLAIFKTKFAFQLEVVSAILSAPVLPDKLQFLCSAFGMQGFCCSWSLLTLNSKCVISFFDEKYVHLMGQHCPFHPLKMKKVHAADHLLHSCSILHEFYLSG